MALTYGMIGDRLSDLVAELREINEAGTITPKQLEISHLVAALDSIRAACDALAMAVL